MERQGMRSKIRSRPLNKTKIQSETIIVSDFKIVENGDDYRLTFQKQNPKWDDNRLKLVV